jgi:hypothetical protein
VNRACVLLNGWEPETVESAAGGFMSVSTARGPTSIPGGGAGGRTSGPELAPTASGGWLGFFRANEVELVEVYPAGSETSRTFCGRFQPSTGCSCPPDPSGIVLWLRN